jgi:hypothetical protein
MLMAVLVAQLAAAVLRSGVRQCVCVACLVGLLLTNALHTALDCAFVSLQGTERTNSKNSSNNSTESNNSNNSSKNNSTTLEEEFCAEIEKELIAEILRCLLALAGAAVGFGSLAFVYIVQPALKKVGHSHRIVHT